MEYDAHASAMYLLPTHQVNSSSLNHSYFHDPSLESMTSDALSQSPTGMDSKTCTDPRLLHTNASFWSSAPADDFAAHGQDHDDESASTIVPGFHPEHWSDDHPQMPGQSSWVVDNSMTVAGNMFSTTGDATGDSILTPPDSGACDSPSPLDDLPQHIKTEDEYAHRSSMQDWRPSSARTARSNSPHLRADGYKKKNAKFEIPPDRTLANIDSLIEDAKARGDEKDLKEFKTQKRLLRNREAALHSRQKKKDYTCMLEIHVKQLDSELGAIKATRKQQAQHVNYLSSQLQQASAHAMHLESERNMLQAKLAMLEQSLCSASPPMSTGPSPTAFTDNPDMLGWPAGNMNVADTVHMDQSATATNPDSALMLLMAGALNALPASQRPRPARLPEAVVSSAPAILDAIFQRAGVHAPPFQQAASSATGLNSRAAGALDQLVRPEAVAHFRRLVSEANLK